MASTSRRFKRNSHAAETGSRGISDKEVARALVGGRGDPRRAALILEVHQATVYKRIAGNVALRRLKKQLELENVE